MRRLWTHVGIVLALIVLIIVVAASATDARPRTEAQPTRLPTSRLSLVINIPAFRLEAFLDDTLVRTIPIAAGMPAFKSPRGNFAVTSVEWNPWWIPPKSKWAAKEKITPPGPGNPMGRVKINFHELYFMHGTPLDASIGSAASHGCIRLHNSDAITLADLVLQYGAVRLTADDRTRLAADTATRRVELDTRVPVSLKYDRVELRNDTLYVYRDVYGFSTQGARGDVDSLLSQLGVDPLRVDTVRRKALTRGIGRRGNAMVLSDLVHDGDAR